uniref:Uncharacterized protein n=1 Tax=Plectus sambesii TaxID=2011161 RepID=A0A914US08_9BILA
MEAGAGVRDDQEEGRKSAKKQKEKKGALASRKGRAGAFAGGHYSPSMRSRPPTLLAIDRRLAHHSTYQRTRLREKERPWLATDKRLARDCPPKCPSQSSSSSASALLLSLM